VQQEHARHRLGACAGLPAGVDGGLELVVQVLVCSCSARIAAGGTSALARRSPSAALRGRCHHPPSHAREFFFVHHEPGFVARRGHANIS